VCLQNADKSRERLTLHPSFSIPLCDHTLGLSVITIVRVFICGNISREETRRRKEGTILIGNERKSTKRK